MPQPDSAPAAPRHLVCRHVTTFGLPDLDFEVPLGKLTLITGAPGVGKTALCRDTLAAESASRVRRFLGQTALPNPAHCENIQELQPVIDLVELAKRLPESAVVSRVLGIDDYILRLFSDLGTVRCDQVICELRPAGVLKAAHEITRDISRGRAEAVASGPPDSALHGSRLLFGPTLTFSSPLTAADRSGLPGIVSQLKTYGALGFERLLIGGEIFRGGSLSEAGGEKAWEAALTETIDRAVAAAVNATLTSIVVLVRSIAVSELLTESGEDHSVDLVIEALRESLSLGRSLVEANLQQAPKEAPTQTWYCRPEYFCARCAVATRKTWGEILTENPMDVWQTEAINAPLASQKPAPVLAGVSLNAFWNLPLQQLQLKLTELSADHPAKELLCATLRKLAGLELGQIFPGQLIAELSRGERIKIACARLLLEQFSDVVILLDEPARFFTSDETRELLGALSVLQGQGSSLVVTSSVPAEGILPEAHFEVSGDFPAGVSVRPVTLGAKSKAKRKKSSPAAIERVVSLQILAGAAPSPRTTTRSNRGRKLPLLEFADRRGHVLTPGTLHVLHGPSGSGKTRLMKQWIEACERGGARHKVAYHDLARLEVIAWSKRAPMTLARVLGLDRVIAKLFAGERLAVLRGKSVKDFLIGSRAARCVACGGWGIAGGFAEALQTAGQLVSPRCGACVGTGIASDIQEIQVSGIAFHQWFDLSVDELLKNVRGTAEIAAPLAKLVRLGLAGHRLGIDVPSLPYFERQRAGICAAILQMQDEVAVCFDHGVSGLPGEETKELFGLLHEIAESGVVVVVTSPSAVNLPL